MQKYSSWTTYYWHAGRPTLQKRLTALNVYNRLQETSSFIGKPKWKIENIKAFEKIKEAFTAKVERLLLEHIQ